MSRPLFVQGAALVASLCCLLGFAHPAFAQAAPPAPPPTGSAEWLWWFWTNIIVPGLGTW